MPIELLLLDDVEGLGRSGDVVKVKPGYARNFLLPKQRAVNADKRTLKMQARLKEERHQKMLVDKAESEQLAAKINGVILTTIVKVDHEGHMFGSVTVGDIVELLNAETGVEIEKRAFQLKHPIKETGVFNISLKLKEGVVAAITVKVISEAAAKEMTNENEEKSA